MCSANISMYVGGWIANTRIRIFTTYKIRLFKKFLILSRYLIITNTLIHSNESISFFNSSKNNNNENNFVICAIRKVQESNLELDMNNTHQVLVCADNVNLISDIRTIVRNADVLLNACKDIGLAVNTGKTKCFTSVVR